MPGSVFGEHGTHPDMQHDDDVATKNI